MDIYRNIALNHVNRNGNNSMGFLSAAANSNGIFQKDVQNLSGHLKEIHELLNSGKTREQGITLLEDVVGQCPRKTFQEHGLRWFKLCSQALSSMKGGQGKTRVCRILLQVLRHVSFSQDLHRAITTRPPGSLILLLAAAESSWNCIALECLCEYLKIAPVPCLPFKANLEKSIYKYLDTPLDESGCEGVGVRWAGHAYAILPLPGKGGGGTQAHTEARARHLTPLLALAHSLMDQLFKGIIENEAYEHTRDHGLKLDSWESKNDPMGELLHAFTRLINTITFTAAFLTNHTTPTLTLAPHDVLSVVFRILQLELSVVQKYQSQEHKLVAFLLPIIQQHALLLLQDILYSIGEAVDLYWGPIMNLLMLVVKCYSAASVRGGHRTRVVAYAVLETLLQVSKGRHPPSPALLTHVIEDFTPKLHHVTLQTSGGMGSGLKLMTLKNKKKKGYKVVTSDTESQVEPMSSVSDDDLCDLTNMALRVTQAALSHSAHSLHYKAHQQLQSALLNVCSCVIGLAPSRRPSLYVPGFTRAALVGALATLTTSPNPRWPPPYTLAIELFSAGLSDDDAQVTNACQLALDSVRIIAANPQATMFSQTCQHPSHTSEHQDEEEDDMNFESGIPEQNNASTLAEKQPDEDSDEEHFEDVEEEEREEHVQEDEEEHEEDGDKEGDEEENEVDDDKEEDEVEKEETKLLKETEGGNASPGSKNEQEVYDVESEMEEAVDEESDKSTKKQESDKAVHPTKRPADPTATVEEKKTKKSKEEKEGPSLEEMMSTFVDSDPDS